ncbi:undecaprenyldiphospho-muramoylpentapeptide beta-N-acetylglucosaminyltransferase [Actinocrispum sp. NPDC049592]|uniref:undecaprenyldiphospho-muramoylpentapeptide beta-N-acetylglucosaminyltransferase n=1 Tax=Actinocrispum sp. NPDC049592 TaxID=3154835 RepID=UPI003448F925
MIAAGGTGGHIYPGLALAEAIKAAEPDVRVTFVGTRRGLEGRIIPKAGYPLTTVDMVPLTKKDGWRFPVALAVASRQCRKVLRDNEAHVAVGMGGYTSAPLVLAARMAGLPSVIHDANAVPGRANRFSARLTENVALAFEEAADHLPRNIDSRTVGMPLVASLATFDRAALRPVAREALSLPDSKTLVLVNGGSLGADRLNEAAIQLALRWRRRTDVRMIIKAGKGGADAINQQLDESGARHIAESVHYIESMDMMYAAADVAVCRAGAATIAELGQVGLPAVLVPYPYAPHDHQTRNAEALVQNGAAVLLPDNVTTAAALEVVLGGLVDDPGRRERMAAAALRTARPHAARHLARWVTELAMEHR